MLWEQLLGEPGSRAGSRVGESTQERVCVTQVCDWHNRAHESNGGHPASAAHDGLFPSAPRSCLSEGVTASPRRWQRQCCWGFGNSLLCTQSSAPGRAHAGANTRTHALTSMNMHVHMHAHTYMCSHTYTHVHAHKHTGLWQQSAPEAACRQCLCNFPLNILTQTANFWQNAGNCGSDGLRLHVPTASSPRGLGNRCCHQPRWQHEDKPLPHVRDA